MRFKPAAALIGVVAALLAVGATHHIAGRVAQPGVREHLHSLIELTEGQLEPARARLHRRPTDSRTVGLLVTLLLLLREHRSLLHSVEHPRAPDPAYAASDRVLVLRDGAVAAELPRSEIADEESLQLAVQGVSA